MNVRWPYSSPPWLTCPWPPTAGHACRGLLCPDEYRQVLAAGFGEGPKEADWVGSVFAIIGLESHSRWRHFVGTVADDPVVSASTLLTDSTAGIYFVCARPDARRRANAGHRSPPCSSELPTVVPTPVVTTRDPAW